MSFFFMFFLKKFVTFIIYEWIKNSCTVKTMCNQKSASLPEFFKMLFIAETVNFLFNYPQVWLKGSESKFLLSQSKGRVLDKM